MDAHKVVTEVDAKFNYDEVSGTIQIKEQRTIV